MTSNKQIGWSQEAILLHAVSKQLERLAGLVAASGGGGGGSGTVSAGTANRLAYYSASGTTVSNLAAITANRVLVSNSSGLPVASTVADTELGYNRQAIVAGTVIDWNNTHQEKTLSANTVFTFSNTGDAKTIIIAVKNVATNFTVTWPTVDWGSAGAPVQRTGTATDVYTFVQINGIIYGNVRQ